MALDVLGSWRPHLILLELMMPEVDGWTFRAKQLALDGVAEIPIIVFTAVETIRAIASPPGRCGLHEASRSRRATLHRGDGGPTDVTLSH